MKKNKCISRRLDFVVITIFIMTLLCCNNIKTPNYPDDSIEAKIVQSIKSNGNYDTYVPIDVSKFCSIKTSLYKDSIKGYIERIEGCKQLINDSSIISILNPEIFSVEREFRLMLLQDEEDYTWYKIVSVNKNDEENKKSIYAKVDNKFKSEISLLDEVNPNKFVMDYNEQKTIYERALYVLEYLCRRDHSELIKMKNEELKRQENLKIAEEKAKREELERNYVPGNWNEVGTLINKKYKCKVIGIWKGDSYSPTLVIYTKGGNYYLNYCKLDKEPINDGNEMLLKKKSNNIFEYNEEGSDMPERFAIKGNHLYTYTFNPDSPYGPEWVFMGSYTNIY